jgi:enolase
MEHKISIITEDQQLIYQILELIKDEQATFRLEQTDKKSSEKLVEIMNQIAAKNPIKSIKDPQSWQREVRKDKKLMGRD